MRLSCQEHLIPGRDLVEKWELVSAAGYDGIELHGHGDFGFRERLDELRTARSAGAVMPTVCVIMDHFIGDFDEFRRRDAIENMKSLLSVIADIGGTGAITPASYGMFSRRLPPYEPPRTQEEDREVLLAALAELGEHASREGVSVFLEPLNRYEDHMVNRLEQAVSLCAEAGSNALEVMGDTFHMNIEEDDPPAAIRAAAERLAHVHLSDSNRAHPGSGHFDFASTLVVLKEIDFDGYMALECAIRGEPKAVLTGVASYVQRGGREA
ncbi:MAG: sugar phosphate isomerase/epimerase [Actinobacteria bacterium]|nr:sugar phosphate isomerase/epimerase [Actinomycetota bacterium]